MREAVERLWPEIQWIKDAKLREQVTQAWIKALERSPLKPEDLNQIPFTLLVPNCPITFMEHKRCVVHIARDSAKAMTDFMGRALPIDADVVIAASNAGVVFLLNAISFLGVIVVLWLWRPEPVEEFGR